MRQLSVASCQLLAKACCEMSRRDGAIVAWHEMPGKDPPQKSRPVGYGVMRTGKTLSQVLRARLRSVLSLGGRAGKHFATASG
jgi:hypothetical protein